jgi:uncharacterized membrane protein
VSAMGGPATDLLKPAPAGGEMAGMQHGAMKPAAADSTAHAHPAAATPGAKPMADTAGHAQVSPAAVKPGAAPPRHEHAAKSHPSEPATPGGAAAPPHEHGGEPAAGVKDSSHDHAEVESAVEPPAGWFPIHSGHPLVVHFPLVALLLAVLLDVIAAIRRSPAWRGAATLLWWVGLAGAAAAIGTGLLAYGRVDHSELAHQAMVRHRNLALAAVAILVISATWRWRRPLSGSAAAFGIIGALLLASAAYLGGDMVYRHGVGIPTAVLHEVMEERGGHEHSAPAHPAESTSPRAGADTSRDSTRASTKSQPHSNGEKHEP